MSQNPPHLPRHSPSTLSYQMIYAYLAERSRYASKKKVKRFIVIVVLSISLGGRTQQMFTTTTKQQIFIKNWKITNYITFPPENSL